MSVNNLILLFSNLLDSKNLKQTCSTPIYIFNLKIPKTLSTEFQFLLPSTQQGFFFLVVYVFCCQKLEGKGREVKMCICEICYLQVVFR